MSLNSVNDELHSTATVQQSGYLHFLNFFNSFNNVM